MPPVRPYATTTSPALFRQLAAAASTPPTAAAAVPTSFRSFSSTRLSRNDGQEPGTPSSSTSPPTTEVKEASAASTNSQPALSSPADDDSSSSPESRMSAAEPSLASAPNPAAFSPDTPLGDAQPTERYFGIWPQEPLRPLVQNMLSQTIAQAAVTRLDPPLLESIEAQLKRFARRFEETADRQPRVVLMHHSDLTKDPAMTDAWRLIWNKFALMGKQADSPDYQLAFDYLVFDDFGMVLTVADCSVRPDGALALTDTNFWGLPAGSEARFSLTVLHPPRALPNGNRIENRLEYAPSLAAIFRHHLAQTPAAGHLAAGRFELNGFSGTFVRLDGATMKGKFAPKLFDDSIYHPYSCPEPRVKGPRPPLPRRPFNDAKPSHRVSRQAYHPRTPTEEQGKSGTAKPKKHAGPRREEGSGKSESAKRKKHAAQPQRIEPQCGLRGDDPSP